MTPDEHLDAIVAKCDELLTAAEQIRTMSHDIVAHIFPQVTHAEAGWQVTKAAIAGLRPIAAYSDGEEVDSGFDEPSAAAGARETLNEIRAAWPEELL